MYGEKVYPSSCGEESCYPTENQQSICSGKTENDCKNADHRDFCVWGQAQWNADQYECSYVTGSDFCKNFGTTKDKCTGQSNPFSGVCQWTKAEEKYPRLPVSEVPRIPENQAFYMPSADGKISFSSNFASVVDPIFQFSQSDNEFECDERLKGDVGLGYRGCQNKGLNGGECRSWNLAPS